MVGFLLVLLAGSLLVLAITDRGHDPQWVARPGIVDTLDVAPDGSVVYALVRAGENATRLEARRGDDGSLLWESTLSSPRALLSATRAGVVVATDFPRAFLTGYGADGSIRYQAPLEGNPRAIASESGRVVVALQAPGNPVVVYEAGTPARTHRFNTFVNAIDLRAGRIAAGTGDGQVTLLDTHGEVLLNASLPLSVRSLRLSADGVAVIVGGFSLTPGDLSGLVAFLDATEEAPVRWIQRTPVGVGLVDMDRAGVHALAVGESPPQDTLYVYAGATGDVVWSRRLDGNVARDDAGSLGGASMAPDGRAVAAATLRSGVHVYEVPGGEERWSYGSEGSTLVSFARDDPRRMAANARLLQNGPFDALLAFRAGAGPRVENAAVVAVALVAADLAVIALVLGVGYWRVRRSY